MAGYHRGGHVRSLDPTLPIRLLDDECVLNRQGECVREDDKHLYEVESYDLMGGDDAVLRTWDYKRCLHRPCHVVPVESVVTGELLARLCRVCDTQLES